jgi:hypothetical protein
MRGTELSTFQQAGMANHPGYKKHDRAGHNSGSVFADPTVCCEPTAEKTARFTARALAALRLLFIDRPSAPNPC